MRYETDGRKDNVVVTEGKAHFFVLKVHKRMSTEAPLFILVKALNKEEATRNWENMRPKAPILKIEDFDVIGIYDCTSKREMDDLHAKNGDKFFTFYIKKTEIGTYYPYSFTRRIDDVSYRDTKTTIALVQGTLTSSDQKVYRKMEDKIQMHLATSNTTTSFWNNSSSDGLMELVKKNGENLSIVLFDENISNTITLMRDVYKNMEGSKSLLNFFYAMGPDVYEILLDEEFRMARV